MKISIETLNTAKRRNQSQIIYPFKHSLAIENEDTQPYFYLFYLEFSAIKSPNYQY
jgi:hypothetical protein